MKHLLSGSLLTQHPRILLYSVAVGISFFLFFWMFMKSGSEVSSVGREESSLDTLIPKGFVLVPIEIQNYKSLDSALGPYGMVDLYAPRSLGSSSYKLVAKGIQILRSPYPPYEFAVMAPEDKAKLILEVKGAFKIAIQNPEVSSMRFETETKNKKKKRKIFVEF